MTDLVKQPLLILFTGLPGTLKTFISGRVAQKLGCAWLPTLAFGNIEQPTDGSVLSNKRAIRYSCCLDALQTLSLMSARAVVDGGFIDVDLQREVFSTYSGGSKLLIRCVADADSRLARLKVRSGSSLDVEQASAKDIVNMRAARVNPLVSEAVHTPEFLGCDAIVEINTTNFVWNVEGLLDVAFQERLRSAIELTLAEFRATDKNAEHDALMHNFADLAHNYEETTEWRTDSELLAQLRVDLPKKPSDVLDIGSGTGIAAQWYTEQGHQSVGVDLSPQMSKRAASRILFTNFGSAMDLPYFEESFDLVLMRQMLHYTEPVLAMQEVRRILRNDGQFIIASAIASSTDVKPVWEEFKNVTQPLRLRVFTEYDLSELLLATGFTIVENRHASLTRCEPFTQIEKRARKPASGWIDFMKMMEQIFAEIAPEMEFKAGDSSYSYKQFWITLIARQSND